MPWDASDSRTFNYRHNAVDYLRLVHVTCITEDPVQCSYSISFIPVRVSTYKSFRDFCQSIRPERFSVESQYCANTEYKKIWLCVSSNHDRGSSHCFVVSVQNVNIYESQIRTSVGKWINGPGRKRVPLNTRLVATRLINEALAAGRERISDFDSRVAANLKTIPIVLILPIPTIFLITYHPALIDTMFQDQSSSNCLLCFITESLLNTHEID